MFCTVSNFKDVQSQLSFVNIGSYPSHKSFKSLKQKSPFFGFQMFPVARPPETIARNLALAAQERSMDTTAKVRVLRATLGPDTQKAKTTNFLATRVSEGLGKTWSTCQNLPKIMAYLSVPWLGLLYVVGITNQMCILYVWSWMKLKTRLSIRSSQGPGLSF